MLSVDEIMDDFRRNGQDCDFVPVQDTADRTWSYNPASPSWNAWPPEYYTTSQDKGSAFSVSNAHLKLARAISALSLSAAPTTSYPPPPQQHTRFCQHRGTNSNHCSNVFGSSCDPMFSADRADVLNFLQGNSLIHNELVKLIHEKAHALSQVSKLRQDETNYLNSRDYLKWSNKSCDQSLPIQAPRNVTMSRGRTRTNSWERYESGGISGRSSPIPRDTRFEMRPCQPSPRIGSCSRYVFNRTTNLKPQRDVEVDRVSNDSLVSPPFSLPSPSVASFTPTTPESLNSSEETVKETVIQEAPITTITKPSINGSVRGRKASSAATSSLKSSVDGSCPSSPETTTPHSPMTLRDSPNATAATASKPAAKRETGGGARARARARPRGDQNCRRVRYLSESQQTGGCAFCKKNGETPSVYKNHVAKDAEGQTVCDILQKYVCPLCGATGKKAHTVKYCPSNLNPHPSPSEKLRSSRGGAHPSRPQKKSANGTH